MGNINSIDYEAGDIVHYPASYVEEMKIKYMDLVQDIKLLQSQLQLKERKLIQQANFHRKELEAVAAEMDTKHIERTRQLEDLEEELEQQKNREASYVDNAQSHFRELQKQLETEKSLTAFAAKESAILSSSIKVLEEQLALSRENHHKTNLLLKHEKSLREAKAFP